MPCTDHSFVWFLEDWWAREPNKAMGLDHFLWFYASARDLVFLGIFVSLLDPLALWRSYERRKYVVLLSLFRMPIVVCRHSHRTIFKEFYVCQSQFMLFSDERNHDFTLKQKLAAQSQEPWKFSIVLISDIHPTSIPNANLWMFLLAVSC